MDKQFTEKIVAWLETPVDERDYEQGALYLLQLNNNQIMYRNVTRNLKKHAEFIEYQIRKYVKFRLASLTHEQVEEMQAAVEKIVAERRLDKEPSTEQSTDMTAEQKEVAEFKAGKRPDHDELPDEIQALYVENANIMRQMRELHLKLRMMSTENATCPDSERYPFLKEIIKLDKQYHKNWQVYDSFDPALAAAGAEQQLISDARAEQTSIYRQINLSKGRYKKALKARAENGTCSDSLPSAEGLAKGKNPTDALKQQIADLYAQLASPVDTLTEELREMGIIPAADETDNVD